MSTAAGLAVGLVIAVVLVVVYAAFVDAMWRFDYIASSTTDDRPIDRERGVS